MREQSERTSGENLEKYLGRPSEPTSRDASRLKAGSRPIRANQESLPIDGIKIPIMHQHLVKKVLRTRFSNVAQ